MSCEGGMPSARITSAASGSRITADRKNVVKPNVSPKPGSGLGTTIRLPANSAGPVRRPHDQDRAQHRALQQTLEPRGLGVVERVEPEHQHRARVHAELASELGVRVAEAELRAKV